ncbi:hypothetical protein LV476_02460 [Guyparkeria hydrothermalis]|uniref:hypothetical protein n=1 Tax=Guyparkeria hydrothermalis TaxID=923 RepID=UPI002022163D|nr:hypothetical protein [Guyparkeria hydrothermalis]MCL7743816.1 hypothetical protein [Guyparkeria hydrothermalis]
MPSWPTVRRWLIGALLVANLGLAHWLGDQSPIGPGMAILALAPLVGVIVLAMQPRLAWPTTLLLAVLLGLSSLGLADVLDTHIAFYYLVQHLGVNLALAVFFLGSLRGDQQPACARFAAQVHDHLTAPLRRYTRQITWAWGLFFIANAILSIALMAALGPSLWSAYAVYATFPLVAAMFAGEYMVRLWVLPREDWTGPIAAVRAYRRHMLQMAGERK